MANEVESDVTDLTVSELLKAPYRRVIIPQDDGTFFAEIAEFPGCFATGQTRQEALEMLEEVAESWLMVAIEAGQEIPKPIQDLGYSGKTVLRMPKTLHRDAAMAAEHEGVSLNQYIVACLARGLGSQQLVREEPKAVRKPRMSGGVRTSSYAASLLEEVQKNSQITTGFFALDLGSAGHGFIRLNPPGKSGHRQSTAECRYREWLWRPAQNARS
jgi:antitoxin HicB